ncbi:MAG TPA: exodeoxyribonuclease V subunit alpha [Solirubrobacteraceae bacterium]|nr:exodeoxyribonuclease V subunit alpha [Solirubrobacteraceae bacterium]
MNADPSAAGRFGGAPPGAELFGAELFGAELALRAPAGLREFNRAGVLAAADVHVATELGRLAGVSDARALLAAALAVRAPRLGNVFVDLATARDTVTAEEVPASELLALAWPEPLGWAQSVRALGRLVAVGEGEDPAEVRPLRLIGTRLYLDRYWREERQLAVGLAGFAERPLRAIDSSWLTAGLARLFPDPADALQRAAAACLVLRSLAVVAGGPGTGKTTTVARAAALLAEAADVAGRPAPLIALCAPTGKAAARLQEAVHQEAEVLPVNERVRDELRSLRAGTIHRLLGWRPGSYSRFRHDSFNRLPHDVVIVDETSMVSLSLMARLVEAIRSDAQLVLVGDPDQLTAVEAGAVLRDIVGPVGDGPRMTAGMQALLRRVAGDGVDGPAVEGHASFGNGIVALRRGHRFGVAIGELADAVRRGDADGAVAAGRRYPDDIVWVELDVADPEQRPEDLQAAIGALRAAAVDAGAAVVAAARDGEAEGALAALGEFRMLCAHRRGPYGAARWASQAERWLAEAVEGFSADGREYPGRPLLVTENDYELRLYNGDTGVVVRTEGGLLAAAFLRDGRLVRFAPSRLDSAETLYAMTIHKSQGSQFETAAVLLPDQSSRILTRELLYTAVTRARRRLILVGSETSLRAAVARPVARATGLRERLWGG